MTVKVCSFTLKRAQIKNNRPLLGANLYYSVGQHNFADSEAIGREKRGKQGKRFQERTVQSVFRRPKFWQNTELFLFKLRTVGSEWFPYQEALIIPSNLLNKELRHISS